jgi:hypothetical protein
MEDEVERAIMQAVREATEAGQIVHALALHDAGHTAAALWLLEDARSRLSAARFSRAWRHAQRQRGDGQLRDELGS